MIRRTLRYQVINDHDGETNWADVVIDVDENAPAFLTAVGLVAAPYVVMHAEWVEMPGQEVLL